MTRTAGLATGVAWIGTAVATGLAWAAVAAAATPEVRIGVSKGPHYLGEPIELQITAQGFEEEPEPEVVVPTPVNGRLDFVGASPSVSTSISIVGGRVTRMKEVKFVYTYRFVAGEPGEIDIGRFAVRQGGLERVTPIIRLDIRPVASSERVGVALSFPEEPVFVGQRVPVTLTFRLERELQNRLQGYTLRVPLFDLSKSFRLLEPEDPGEVEVNLETASGRLRVLGRARQIREGDENFFAVDVERALVPLRPGRVEIPAATVVVEEAVRWRRDFFGGRVATHVRKLSASDRPRTLDVKPIPEQGRPASFAGAVGSGFSLDAAADRTVVQVGEPITLTLSLRGGGNLDAAGFPPLDAQGLLPPPRFRAPSEPLTGTVEEDVKRFTAVVRVLDDDLTEIPALEYAWFDPETEHFEVTRSRPIALSVRSAEVIGAADVLRADAAEEGAPGGAQEKPTPREIAPRARSFALTGADLAIERDPGVLLRDGRASWGGSWLPTGLYGGSTLAVLLAWVDRRRRDVDPELQRRRAAVRDARRRIRAAGARPGAEAAAELARALRALAADVAEARSPELDALVGACDAWSYAPRGRSADDGAREDLVGRALALADAAAEQVE